MNVCYETVIRGFESAVWLLCFLFCLFLINFQEENVNFHVFSFLLFLNIFTHFEVKKKYSFKECILKFVCFCFFYLLRFKNLLKNNFADYDSSFFYHVKLITCSFLAHLAKGKVSFCHHLAFVVH